MGKLDCNAKQWYLGKLITINNTDQYYFDWIKNPDAPKPLYLVFGLKEHNLCEFKSYKFLKAHEQICRC